MRKRIATSKEAGVSSGRSTMAVRLDLHRPEYDKLDERARRLGLNKSAYARMIIMMHLRHEAPE